MLPILVPLPELVQADEVGVEDRHVAPVDRDGLLGDEDAVGVVRKSGSVALDQILDGLSRRTFDLKPGSQGLLLLTNVKFYVSSDICIKAPSNIAINRLKKLVEAHFFDFPRVSTPWDSSSTSKASIYTYPILTQPNLTS